MKLLKKSAVIITAVILSVLFVFCASAVETGISDLSVSFEAGDGRVSVSWWKGDGQYFLFLPSDADMESLSLSFTASADVTLDGEAVENGEAISLEAGKKYILASNGVSYTLTVLKSENIPSLHITTESGSMDAVHADKSHKEPAVITILADGDAVIEDSTLDYIKGRGNSTWSMKKKPYNIKFEKKTDLFEMGTAKKWSLLANYTDKSLLRNVVAYNLADNLGLEFVSKCVSVDLYVDGDYYGNYLLCESVEVGDTRVDINDLEGDTEDVNEKDLDAYSLGGAQQSDYKKLTAGTQKWVNIPNNPENITGGYLLEYELPNRYVNEVSGFITSRNQTIVLKAPEYASEAQVKYISALYQDFEDAVFSANGYNSKGKHYTEYIDVESFVTMYVFQEYAKNLDAAVTSFYIYKDIDSDILVASPVWDFDFALGNSYSAYDTNISEPSGWWASGIYYKTDNDTKYLSTILNALFRHDDFAALASDEWNSEFAPVLNDEYFNGIKTWANEISASAVMNAILWDTYKTSDATKVKSEYEKQANGVLVNFMKNRKAFLDKGFAENSVRVYFDGNGGTGNMFNRDAVKVGDSYTLPQCEYTNYPKYFVGWSTTPDGSSGLYDEGDTVILERTKVTFYAQWKEVEVLSGFRKFIQSIKNFFEMIRNFFANLFK
ncbi:MAG: CotH kinase family protein [Clostridia bacterium]|nr:CotH kinase family protein [Clostridia bacterium]